MMSVATAGCLRHSSTRSPKDIFLLASMFTAKFKYKYNYICSVCLSFVGELLIKTIKPQNKAEVVEGLAYHDCNGRESHVFRLHSIPSNLFHAHFFDRTFGMYNQPQLNHLRTNCSPVLFGSVQRFKHETCTSQLGKEENLLLEAGEEWRLLRHHLMVQLS